MARRPQARTTASRSPTSCGQSQPAPFTDGSRCIDDHDDYDRAWENGCEAVPDDQDERPLDQVVSANIVPADDVDTYPMEVEDHLHLLCDGTVELWLEAPPGMALSAEVYDDDRPIESATATAETPGVITLGEAECGGDDGRPSTWWSASRHRSRGLTTCSAARAASSRPPAVPQARGAG